MKTIYKYGFGGIQNTRTIEMPKGAKVIHVGTQDNAVYIWAMIDTEVETEERKFRIYGTGHPMVSDFVINHVASFFLGPFVWHLFEELK